MTNKVNIDWELRSDSYPRNLEGKRKVAEQFWWQIWEMAVVLRLSCSSGNCQDKDVVVYSSSLMCAMLQREQASDCLGSYLRGWRYETGCLGSRAKSEAMTQATSASGTWEISTERNHWGKHNCTPTQGSPLTICQVQGIRSHLAELIPISSSLFPPPFRPWQIVNSS